MTLTVLGSPSRVLHRLFLYSDFSDVSSTIRLVLQVSGKNTRNTRKAKCLLDSHDAGP